MLERISQVHSVSRVCPRRTRLRILHLSRYTGVRNLREIVFPPNAVRGLVVCPPLDRAGLAPVARNNGEVQVPPVTSVVIRVILGLRYSDRDSENMTRVATRDRTIFALMFFKVKQVTLISGRESSLLTLYCQEDTRRTFCRTNISIQFS